MRLPTWGSWKRGFLAIGGLVVVGLAGGAAGGAIGAWRTVCYDCPSIAQLYTWEPRQSTKILSADGAILDELALERRTPVEIDSLPDHVPNAFVAIEDKRFYRHPGYDVRGYLRAVKNLVTKRRIEGGGSTITLQLARHMFIEELGFDQSFRRKLKELHVAMDLERVYSKDQILQAYINQVNYDQGWYGIESAAQNYFGKSAPELNPAEAATLAGVINLPAYYNPLKHPERSRQRRDLILRLMANQGYIPRAELAHWQSQPVPERRAESDGGQIAPYFVEWVRTILDDRFGADLYSKGYRVYTTLDIGLQKRAQEAMERGWRRVESVPGYAHPRYGDEAGSDRPAPAGSTPYLQGSLIALDPATGDVKALIGGRDIRDSKFNRATQARRQPGSVFKPFVYTAAIASGIPPSRVMLDAPVNLQMFDGSRWSPRNYTNDFRGEMTLRNALRVSINVIAVKLGMEVGLETVAQYAQRMGISTEIPRVPSLPIGVPDVLLIDVAEAYTAFANLGEKVEPRAVLRVEDSEGRVLWSTEVERERVLDDKVAYIMIDMLKDVVDAGSAMSIRDPARGNIPDTLPVAGKTGTTNDGSDVWFAGFTPDLLAIVWLGFDMRTQILPNAAGGVYAAPVWADFVRPLYFGAGGSGGGEPAEAVEGAGPLRSVPPDWIAPGGLTRRTVDSESGKLATEWCPVESLEEEIFLPGTEPTEACDLHSPGLFGLPLRGIPHGAEPIPDTVRPDTIRD
ncbi:MAG TPA: PBP1A family penicillin-binding protein [Longimicrobiales bacterium]|nr:PBP1A family penicillin-binding protein [Longimicrobiales bacterium]